MEQTCALIIGASVSGLSVAACFKKAGIDFIIIEKEAQAATPWRNHYERLHLHTNKRLSNLPYKKFGAAIPKYPSRGQVVHYLETYQTESGIIPVFNCLAFSVKKEDDHWITQTSKGIFKSTYIIVATGAYATPNKINFKGMETFTGSILHSSNYKTGRDFKQQRVLVVGFGNSACEIAIDLYEHGAIPSMSVRSPVNIVPRDLFGIPILTISQWMSKLPPHVADAINAPLMQLMFGDIRKLGLKKMRYGAFTQIRKDGKIPLLDIGTVKHIKQGHIIIYEGIDHIDGNTVHFTDGRYNQFDAIIAAIGYSRNHAEFIHTDKSRFDDLSVSIDKQLYFGKDGLYFCGFWIAPTGQFREIALDAKKIAADIAQKERVGKR